MTSALSALSAVPFSPLEKLCIFLGMLPWVIQWSEDSHGSLTSWADQGSADHTAARSFAQLFLTALGGGGSVSEA